MSDTKIKEILENSKTIAMIGVSSEKKEKIQKILEKTSKCCNEVYARFWLQSNSN